MKQYKKWVVALAVIVVAGITGLDAMAQVPNPRGLDFSITTSGAGDHTNVVSLVQIAGRSKPVYARFISNFVASDSCRVIIRSSSRDSKFKTPAESQIEGTDLLADLIIPIVKDTPYNFVVDADKMDILIAGDARTLTFTGVVEYHE